MKGRRTMRPWKVALTLSLVFHIAKAWEGPLMQNFNCSTDYESHTTCTWLEHQEAKDLVNMTLLQKTNNLDLKKLACSSQKVGSMIRWDCRRNQYIFNVFVEKTFVFKPERKLEVQQNISLFDDVQPPPPQKLGINVTEEGDFLLTWEAGVGTNRSLWLERVLDFEVAYKRIWEPWEMSSSSWVSNASHSLLRHDSLVPGNRYVARVRSKPSQDSRLFGHASDWSPAITWDTPPAEIEALPKNLHCQFNGIDRLKCSWEVRKEVTHSISFALFYQDNLESKQEECFPVHEMKVPVAWLGNSPEHILQSCEIIVTHPQRQSQYLVTVRPKEEEKVVKMGKQIKVNPPYYLSVTMMNSQAYKLEWQPRTVLNIAQIYQIVYWKTGSPWETKYIDVDKRWFIFTTKFLELGTGYTAMVRAKVHDSYYEGTWSDWSMEIHWTTLKGFPFWGILLIAIISIMLLMVGILCGHRYLHRKKKEWEARIPSPPKLFLLPNFFQNVELLDGFEGNSKSSLLQLEGVGDTKVLQAEMLVTHSASLQDELGKTEQPSVASQNGDEEAPSIGKAGQTAIDNTPVLTQSATDSGPVSHPKAQTFAFDGPYLRLPPASFPSDVGKNREATSSDRTAISTCLEKAGLPHRLGSHRLPGKKGAPPSFSAAHEYEDEKQLPFARQKGSQGSRSEKEANGGRKLQNVASTNGSLNYIAVEDLVLGKDLGSFLVSEEGRLPCDGRTTGTPKTTEDLSSLEMPETEPETALPVHSQSLAAPQLASQRRFDDYVTALPAPPGLAPKEGPAFSTDEPKPDKVFLIFHHPGNRSPVLLHQVGDYCFFPGSKLTKEACKSQEERRGCLFPQARPTVEKCPSEKEVDSNMLESSTAFAEI